MSEPLNERAPYFQSEPSREKAPDPPSEPSDGRAPVIASEPFMNKAFGTKGIEWQGTRYTIPIGPYEETSVDNPDAEGKMGRQQTASEVAEQITQTAISNYRAEPHMKLKSTVRRYSLGTLEVEEHLGGNGELWNVQIKSVRSPEGASSFVLLPADLPLLLKYLQGLVEE